MPDTQKRKITPADARALLQSTQQLRTHWSGVITSHIGYAIILNVAIWSFFLKSYTESPRVEAQLSYIAAAAALSAISVGLWRLYTHYLDHQIAGLYPDLILYEESLSVPPSHGTLGYLKKNVPGLADVFSEKSLNAKKQSETVSGLVEKKRIGHRGHLWLDLFALGIIFIMFRASRFVATNPKSVFRVSDIPIIIGFFSAVFGMVSFQKNPSKELIEEIVNEV